MKFLLFTFLFLTFPAVAFAGEAELTRLHDHTFNTDQTWSGTVLIDGIVQFAPEATLTVMPGTVVRFARLDTDGDGIGECEVYIQGQIIARGTKESPIVFTSAAEEKGPGDWGAINIMVSEGKKNVLEHCIIEYSYRGFHMHFSKASVKNCTMRHNYLGIQCQDSVLDVTGCEITGNKGAIVFKDSKLKIVDNNIHDNYWGIRFLYGEAEITGNTIAGHMINGITFRENKVAAAGNTLSGNRKGFSSDMAQVALEGNVVSGSVESGVYLKHSTGSVVGNEISGNGNAGLSVEDSDVRVEGNNITANRNFAVDNNGSMDVDARGNWWGEPDIKKLSGMVFDKSDDPALGAVALSPVAAKPFDIVINGAR